MTSDAPFDLDSFCKTGQRLQSGRFGEQTKSPESRQILVTPDAVGNNEIVHQKTNGTLSTCPPLVLKDSLPLPQWTFYDNLEDDHKEHYLDWLLTSTCRRWRTMGKAVFFSSKTIILEPSTLAALVHGTATNISQMNQAIAVDRICSVIAPLSSAKSYEQIPLYSALPRLRVLRLGLHQSMKNARQGGLHIWNDCPVEFSSLLRDCGLKTEKISIYCYHVIPPAIKGSYTYE